MQFFKGDADELKMYGAGAGINDQLSIQKDLFYESAYSCFKLGEILYDNSLAPLSNAIDRDVFREFFADIFEAFIVSGSFESYMTVFTKIFGEDVVVEFTVPGPAHLQIDITATGFELSDFIARHISGGSYVNDEVMEEIGGANIAFQTVKGFVSEYELNQMLYELVPAGIFTEISLSL